MLDSRSIESVEVGDSPPLSPTPASALTRSTGTGASRAGSTGQSRGIMGGYARVPGTSSHGGSLLLHAQEQGSSRNTHRVTGRDSYIELTDASEYLESTEL